MKKRSLALAFLGCILVTCGARAELPEQRASSRHGLDEPTAIAQAPAESQATVTPASTPTSASPSPSVAPSAGPSPSVAYNTPGEHVIQVLSGDQERSFLLHVPPSYRPGEPLPLVIDLHGRGGTARGEERLSGMSDKADQERFIVVYPQALGAPAIWYVGPGLQGIADAIFLRDLIIFLEERLSIDPRRVYATGFSNGAGMAERLGCLAADRVAAIAPVSGAYVLWSSCRPARPLPVMAFHGTDDAVVPYAGDAVLPAIPDWAAAWAERNGCAPEPTVTYQQGDVTAETWQDCDSDATVTLYTVQGGRHAWPGWDGLALLGGNAQDIDTTDAIWEFFESHPLPENETE